MKLAGRTPENFHVQGAVTAAYCATRTKISIWERIGVALRELFRDIGPKRERATTGARSQKRSALARLNPAQEAIPVRFLKFARHINRLTKSGYRSLGILT